MVQALRRGGLALLLVVVALMGMRPLPVQATSGGGCGAVYGVNTGSIVFTARTQVNMNPDYADLPLDPTRYVPTCLTLQATGIDFYATVTCSITNAVGVGPGYRMWIGVFMDGLHHGEANAKYIPVSTWDYETVQAGSLLERIPPTNYYGVHTFDVRIWGAAGAATIQECNLNVLSFPGVPS